jgi:hypothetical protein
MAPRVIRRRGGTHKRQPWVDNVVASDGWAAALETADQETRDNGATVWLHREHCPKARGASCDCSVVVVGPSVRGVWQ